MKTYTVTFAPVLPVPALGDMQNTTVTVRASNDHDAIMRAAIKSHISGFESGDYRVASVRAN
jgi:hypothetical protein